MGTDDGSVSSSVLAVDQAISETLPAAIEAPRHDAAGGGGTEFPATCRPDGAWGAAAPQQVHPIEPEPAPAVYSGARPRAASAAA